MSACGPTFNSLSFLKPLLQMDRLKKSKSAVWKYCTQLTPGKAVCNTCNEGVSMGATRKNKYTPNLWSHLRSHHPELYDTAQKKQESESHQDEAISSQPTIEDMFQPQRKWTNLDDKSKLMDKLVIEMIVTDNQPFTVVSDVGLKQKTCSTSALRQWSKYCEGNEAH